MKQGALRNFTKFTGKHLCQSLFFNKVVGLRLKLYNIADHDTISVEIDSTDDPLKILKEESESAIKLFRVHNIFVNLDKFQPTVLHKGNKNHNSNITLNIENIIYNKYVKISKTIWNKSITNKSLKNIFLFSLKKHIYN